MASFLYLKFIEIQKVLTSGTQSISFLMNQLYPLKFQPLYKEKIWGGDKIRTVLGKDFSPLQNCGEVWVISGVKGNQTPVRNGFLKGNDLNELVEVYMDDLVGEKIFNKFQNEFPLLIKFIDARDWLSIQVHPDDTLAAKRKIGNGKTEMWYIIGADEGSELISGFNRDVNQKIYLDHLKNKSLAEIINYEKVKPGDVFFMPAGRVHALGPGILLAEIQQTSDTTYRIYDWDRTDDRGVSRELHLEDAMEAIDYKVSDEYRTKYSVHLNETNSVIQSPFFTTNLVEFDREVKKDLVYMDSFVIYICVEGEVELIDENGSRVDIGLGDSVIVPALLEEITLKPKVKSRLLEVYIT